MTFSEYGTVSVTRQQQSLSLFSWSHCTDPELPTAQPHSSTVIRSTLSPSHCVPGHHQQDSETEHTGSLQVSPTVCCLRGFLPVNPPPSGGSMWEKGEQWGSHWTQCLHHQHSGALCTVRSRITEPHSNGHQHKL